MVIAWLTIRLDGHSNEALDHLETVMSGMDKLEDTLDEANTMVSTFSDDLGEARDLLKRVGVDLKDLELEAVADVVGSLKDNRDDLNSILLILVDVQHYINEAKQIDWDALLGYQRRNGFHQSQARRRRRGTQTNFTNNQCDAFF